MKIALIDLETTGLDNKIHEIIELGFIVFDSDTCEIKHKFNFKIKPEHIETASIEALKINGYDIEEWNNAITINQALIFLTKATQDCTFMSHNVTFDWGFIDEAFKKQDIKNPYPYHKLDLLSMAFIKIPHSKVKSWSLKTIATYLGVELEPKIHRAINGAECAYQCYKKLYV